MSEGSVEEFDLPDDGGEYEPCSSTTKGFVFNVEKCEDHDHWIHLNSLGTIVFNASGDISITTEGGMSLSSDADFLLAANRSILNDRVLIPYVDPPATRDGCMEDGKININKLLSFYLDNG